MGAWIETHRLGYMFPKRKVAPYMGAWIETLIRLESSKSELRRTLYGCVD